ncbi:hypothetical protein Btru_004368 [Bulinus truncatus]|nr:hypothetical protein Btru_004368 [Bulinus truncatus]
MSLQLDIIDVSPDPKGRMSLQLDIIDVSPDPKGRMSLQVDIIDVSPDPKGRMSLQLDIIDVSPDPKGRMSLQVDIIDVSPDPKGRMSLQLDIIDVSPDPKGRMSLQLDIIDVSPDPKGRMSLQVDIIDVSPDPKGRMSLQLDIIDVSPDPKGRMSLQLDIIDVSPDPKGRMSLQLDIIDVSPDPRGRMSLQLDIIDVSPDTRGRMSLRLDIIDVSPDPRGRMSHFILQMDTNKVSVIAGICIGLVISAFIVPNGAETVDIVMKGVIPTKDNAYLCTAYTVTNATEFIYEFEALANASIVHHMLLYGCSGPPANRYPNWVCPAMCSRGSRQSILFAWAKNAPSTVLPTDVGFRIGSTTSIKTLVLQVHYAKALSAADYSGIRIYTTEERPKYVAGIYFMVSNSFLIPKGQTAYPVDISCPYNQKNNMTIFAVRGHTHNLGVVVSGYTNNGTSTRLIKKINPQWPQTFYPLEDYIEVKQGDAVFSRCTYNSTLATRAVSVGADGEMCNYYIMYYTDSTVPETFHQCSLNELKGLTGKNFPADGSVPLPPNPFLEEVAKGIAHNSSMSERSVRSVNSEPEGN